MTNRLVVIASSSPSSILIPLANDMHCIYWSSYIQRAQQCIRAKYRAEIVLHSHTVNESELLDEAASQPARLKLSYMLCLFNVYRPYK